MLSPFRIGRDSLFEFSGGPPSQGHSAHFTLVASEVSALHQSERLRACSSCVGGHMRTRARTRQTGASRGGHDRFEKAEEVVESRGWIGQGYSHGAQEFRCVLERCFASSVRLHDPCHSL